MIDLHLHSTASDGSLAPAEVVRRAKAGGHTAIALTDHDTLAGLPEAIAEGERIGLRVIPGVEISLDIDPGTFHMIGLLFDPEDVPLRAALERVRGGRRERNLRLAARLTELEMPMTLEEAEAYAGGEVTARPHFAQAMVDKGYVATIKEAFDRWIGKGAEGYVDRYRLPVEEAISLVHGAGGVTVLCHPASLRLDDGPLNAFATELREMGLDAIEIRYGDRDKARESRFRRVAEAAGLLESGGSDFHGHTKKDQRIGIRASTLEIGPEVLTALEERAAAHREGRS